MKVTLNWLREYVDFDWSPEELTERLTMLGLEVEGVQKTGGEFAGIAVGEVLSRDKHPNADKLSVCRVNDGQGERQIVCGAQNFKAGDKVPLILPGSALPPKPGDKEPFVIKVGKIRGVESHGMMCSGDELGLDPATLGLNTEDGLLILKPEARVGMPFAEYLGRGAADVVYDLEVTPNRPDLNSVIGIAREIAAISGQALRLPAIALPPEEPGIADTAQKVAVRIEWPEACPRYTARIIEGLKVGPSPDWLRTALEKVGLRSINNVVDVTNYVMLETGQPLHAFDYHRVGRGTEPVPTIVVRRAGDAERFVTLDGKERQLTAEDLLIADPEKPIALAGVMGGQNSEVHDGTVDILLESAYFSPTHIRRTSKLTGLRTDASYRFERGADPGITEWASSRAAQLILQTAGGTLLKGVVDVHPAPAASRQITLRHGKVSSLLGVALRPEEIEFYLGQLGLKKTLRRARSVDDPGPPEPATFQVPSFRVDLKSEIDLVEEVARLHGVNQIPATEPRNAKGSHPFDARYDELMEIRRVLGSLGLSEVQGQTLISRTAIRGIPEDEIVVLANPLSADMDALRPSLIPGLLEILGRNTRHQNADLGLFELGRVFRRGKGTAAVVESWKVAIALTGARQPLFWGGDERGAKCDAADLKGRLEEFLEGVGLRGVTCVRRQDESLLFLEWADVALGGRRSLGEIGQLQPRLAKDHDLRDPVFLAELDLDQILTRRSVAKSFKALPAFPASRRDIAMIVSEEVTHDMVLAAIRQARVTELEAVELFDVFRGRHVPEGRKSLAYALTYRGADRTLTDSEVNAAHDRIVKRLKDDLEVELRG